MRIWVRKHKTLKPSGHAGPQGFGLLPLSTQTFTSRDDILILLKEHTAPDDTVNTIMVEMESEYVPVLHATELRIIATLAALYHNACVASACQYELDLYRNPYTECMIPEQDVSYQSESQKDVETQSAQSAQACGETEWDEEMHGEQRIYDETWEMNEDLVPWKLTDMDTEERYGLYM